MTWYRNVRSLILAAAVLSLLLCGFAVAEEQPATASPQAQASATPPAPDQTSAPDDKWHFALTPYLWFPGIHGTVGVDGHYASVHASGADVLSYFNIGLMGALEARKNRFVLPVDFMWVRLSDNHSLPENEPGATSIRARVTETILTPKVGYRIADGEKFKVDALIGFRYWHLGQNISIQPNDLFGGASQSADWVDGVAGARIDAWLSPKAVITVLGDAGGGGANIDYQVAGLLGYKIKNCVLQGGWRYLDVYYRNNSSFTFYAAQTGPVLGVTINLK